METKLGAKQEKEVIGRQRGHKTRVSLAREAADLGLGWASG